MQTHRVGHTTTNSASDEAGGMYEALKRQFRESERTAPRTAPASPDVKQQEAEKLGDQLKQAAKN